MEAYETFKLAFQAQLQTILPAELLHAALESLDAIMQRFEIRPKSTAVTVYSPQPEAMKLFLASKAVEEKSPGTLKTYRSYLGSFFAYVRKPFTDITTNDIRLYLYHCKTEKHYKDNSLETTRRIINAFFDFCQAEELTKKNPCRRIKPIKCEKSTRAAMKPIELEYMRKACIHPREKALVDFLYSTGCRVSEACRCRLSDIDWERKTILIEHGKGKVTRTTFLNPESEVSLREYLQLRRSASEFIFAPLAGSGESPLSPKTIQRSVGAILARAREVRTHVTPHVFRHTVATTALRNGMPVQQVQRFLGHQNINTTMIYAEVDLEDVRASHLKHAS